MSEQFAIDIRDFIEKTKIKTSTALGKIALGVFKDVVMLTPVDIGRARGNWMPSWGKPLIDIDMTAIDKSGSKTLTKIRQTLREHRPGTEWSIFISNSMPYIGDLEYGRYPTPSKSGKTQGGYSIQAPQGMVRVTIAKWSSSSIEALLNAGSQV